MSRHFFIQGEAELVLRCLIEYEHSVLALLVGLGEVPALDNRNAHKLQEVPGDRIALEADLFALVHSAPAHTARLYKVSISPGNVLDLRIFPQFGAQSLGGFRDSTVHVGRDEFLAVKAHVVAEHVLSLKSHERGAYDQRDGNQELQAHEQVPEHTPLGA